MKCIIPCAGESSRMAFVPKMLIQVKNKPVLTHIIDYWSGKVDSFIFVIRRKDTFYWQFFPENSAVVFQDSQKGLADAILKAEPYVDGRFIVALGDCLQKGTFEVTRNQADLGIGVWKTPCIKETKKSYLVSVDNGLVSHVKEKPKMLAKPPYNCGMGTYFLDQRVFDYIRNAIVAPGGGDFTAILQNMIDDGQLISPIWFKGKYINVGSPSDISVAEKVLK